MNMLHLANESKTFAKDESFAFAAIVYNGAKSRH
jgi:hypothetical protein